MQQPELYIGRVRDVLDDAGSVKDPQSAELFTKFIAAFARFAATIRERAEPPDFEAFMQRRAGASRTKVEVLHREASGELGFWTGVEHARVEFHGAEAPLGMKLRVTAIFRFENADFRLVHRHADASGER